MWCHKLGGLAFRVRVEGIQGFRVGRYRLWGSEFRLEFRVRDFLAYMEASEQYAFLLEFLELG